MKKDTQNIVAKLRVIADNLVNQITPDLIHLTELLRDCEKQPGLDVTVGSFASIGYRLCEAFKTTANLGYGARKAINSGSASKFTSEILSALKLISDEIDRLIDGNIVFLSCDIDTLRGHPEVDQATGVGQTLVLIRDQLWNIEERVYALGQEVKALLAVGVQTIQKLEQGPLDPAWKQIQQLITDCMTKVQHLKRRERTIFGPVTHPKPGKNGEPWIIHKPSRPSSQLTWHETGATAVFVPGGQSPDELSGIPMAPWRGQPETHTEWNALDLLMPAFEEPLPPKTDLPLASGVVTVEPDGRFWLVSPTNQYGGYQTTFPKGKLDGMNLSLRANAIKEAFGHLE